MDSLDPSADEIRRWGSAAIEVMANYLGSIREQRVYPSTTAREIRATLERELPDEGVDFERLVESFATQW